MRRRSQSAIEYLFMLAAVLVLVLYTIKVVFDVVKLINKSAGRYISQVRKQVLENM